MSDSSAGPRILDVPADWVLPKLGKRVVPAGGQVETTPSADAITTYDTATGDLAGFGVSLTRGTGVDAVWTLGVDGTTARYPVVGRGIPVEIRDLLVGVRAGAALRVSGRAEHDRLTHRVVDAQGAEVGTVVDVHTRAATTGDGATLTERRHVEVSGWDGPFLDAAVRRLEKFGAAERVAADELDGTVEGRTVGTALQRFLAEQRAAVLSADLDLRRATADAADSADSPATADTADSPDTADTAVTADANAEDDETVHAFRVAIRRIRSALRVVGVAESEPLAAFDAELRWLSGLLGAVRDTQVLREHLRTSVDTLASTAQDPSEADQPGGPDLGATDALVQAALDDAEAAARGALSTALSGRRYLALLKQLRDWTSTPPFTADADAPRKQLSTYVRAAAKDLDRKLAKAGGSAEKLHSARKAAKRARYVASFAGASAGKHGPHVAQRAKSLQTALGNHQDCVMAAEFVASVARTRAGASGAATFGLGVLWVHEQARADQALRRAQKVRTAD